MKRYVLVVLCGLSLAPLTRAATSGSNQGQVTINYNVLGGGTCDVSINGGKDVTVGTGTTLPTLSAFGQVWPQLGKTNFDVTLSNCGGLGMPGKAPSLTMAGTVISGKGDDRLFRDGNSGSAGFGIVFYNTQTPATGSQPQIKKGVPTAVGAAGTALNANQTLKWSAAVSCGVATECTPGASSQLAGGSLAATVTLTFSYA